MMDLASENDASDIAERQLITKYIDKAFNFVQDENSAIVLMEKNLNKNNTAQGLDLETALIDEHGNTKEKLLKIDKVKKQSRRMSQELNHFFENKYGYDGKSTK